MAKTLSMAAAAYKMVCVRVLCFAVLPSASTFVALCKAMGLNDEKWVALGTIGQTVFWVEVAIPGVLGLCAFIDQSMGRAKEEVKRAKAEYNSNVTQQDQIA